MTYLMIDFKHDQKKEQYKVPKGGNKGQLKDTRYPQHTIEMTMIDTENGKVVEIEATAYKFRHEERKPTWSETHLASTTLGKAPESGISQSEFDKLQEERDSARRHADKLEKSVDEKKNIITGLEAENAALNEKVFDPKMSSIVARALDLHMADLASSEEYENYALAKRAYKALTGESWLEGEDDDEEDD